MANQGLNNLFSLFNDIQQREQEQIQRRPNNAINRQRMNNLVFGEETQPYFFNNRGEQMVVAQFNNVKLLTQDITLQFYGEYKFVQMVTSVYGEFFKSRVAQGFTGMKGMNMKAIICAILYLIMMYEEKTKINVDKLIKSANAVKSSTKTKINDKMFYKSVDVVLSHLTTYKNDVNAQSRLGDVDFNIDQDIRRLAISIGYQTQTINKVRKMIADIPQSIKNSHSPAIIAVCIVYMYVKKHEPNNKQKNIESKISMSLYVKQKVLPRIEQAYRGKNISMH